MSTYTVKSGDSMSAIADKLGVSLSDLKAANPQVKDASHIEVGWVLNIPGKSGGTGNGSGGSASSYTVKPGDSMSAIADKLGISLSDLKAANPQITDPNMIQVGWVLNIPGKSRGTGSGGSGSGTTYTVKPGDSFSAIADKLGVSLSALKASNPQVTDPNMIQVGWVLNVPGKSGGSSSGGSGSSGGGSSGLDADQKKALDKHNQARTAISSQVSHPRPSLTWSTHLASSAQQWANQLAASKSLEHSQAGENLYASWGKGPEQACADGADTWLAEKSLYWGQPIDDNFGQYGHYTQMIWPGTKEVGIAKATNGDYVVVVAHYGPAGNFTGESAY